MHQDKNHAYYDELYIENSLWLKPPRIYFWNVIYILQFRIELYVSLMFLIHIEQLDMKSIKGPNK